MRKFTLLLALLGIMVGTVSQAQTTSGDLKGSGEVFYLNTFDWGDPDAPQGWQQPEGFVMEDPTDTGFNWHWWPNDSLDAQWTKEPPFRSSSPEDGHLCLFANLYNNFLGSAEATGIDNSIYFPAFDFSDRASVILRYETNFMQYSPSGDEMQILISVDDGLRWSVIDCDFGVGHKDRPNDVSPGEPAIFQANISEVAAGFPEVIIKIWWHNTPFYYWLIDDFQFAEAWDNDLQLQYYQVEWDDGDENTIETMTVQWPLSQLSGSVKSMEGAVLNFGEMDQYNSFLEIDIQRNSQSVWNATSEPMHSYAGYTDTMRIEDTWTPAAEYGHYKFTYKFQSESEEQTPDDAMKEFFMHVSDSVYSRADDSNELNWSYSFERYADSTDDGLLLDHFVGSKFPIYGDCEVNSVSVYITGGLANGNIEFAGSLWFVPPSEDEEPPFEMLTSAEIYVLDSSMFDTWVTMPLEKDGESEFLYEGDIVYAGLKYWNYNVGTLVKRNKGLGMAVDKSVPMNDPVAVAYSNDGFYTGAYLTKRNLLVKMNLNDSGNIIDGVDLDTNLSSLDQNYPNPFTGRTEIDYSLASASDVIIEVTDITGKVITEMNEGFKPAGEHKVAINAEDYESGIYFYTLKAGNFVETKRMVVK